MIENIHLYVKIMKELHKAYTTKSKLFHMNEINHLYFDTVFEPRQSGITVGIKFHDSSTALSTTKYLFACSLQNPTYKAPCRVEIDDPMVYFDSIKRNVSSPEAVYTLTPRTPKFPLLDCNEEDLESTIFQMSTLYNDFEQLIQCIDFYIKDFIREDIYMCANAKELGLFSTEIYETILKDITEI